MKYLEKQVQWNISFHNAWMITVYNQCIIYYYYIIHWSNLYTWQEKITYYGHININKTHTSTLIHVMA